jgi:cation transport regulator
LKVLSRRVPKPGGFILWDSGRTLCRAIDLPKGGKPNGRRSFASNIAAENEVDDKQFQGSEMPYRSNHDLPPSIRFHLPDHAQDIYRDVFNHAYAAYAGDADRERRAHMIAWAAVKRSYTKDGEHWVRRRQSASS